MDLWRYELTYTIQETQDSLPKDWAVFVYKVTSGDSGHKYYCQLIVNAKTKQQIELCNCPQALGRLPLAILNAVPHLCKHTENLKEYLREKGERK
jgi:hypothetical protein